MKTATHMVTMMKEKQEKAENMLTLVKRCLIEGRYDDALDLYSKNQSLIPQEDIISLFQKHTPSGPICLTCKKEITPRLVTTAIYYSDNRKLWEIPSCPSCKLISYIAKLKEECQTIMASRGIPKRFLGSKLTDFPKQYHKISQGDTGLFLYGSRGVGKTYLMAGIMREKILNTEPIKRNSVPDYYPSELPLFVTVPELLLRIRRSFNSNDRDSETEEEIIKKFGSVKCLFLDDLGTEKTTEWAVQTLFLIINRRYSEMLPTIISSNLSLDQLSKKIDDRITSRIAEMCDVIKIGGKDRRI